MSHLTTVLHAEDPPLAATGVELFETMALFRGTIAIAAGFFASTVCSAAQLEVLQLRPNFYMIAGAGANIGFQVGADGVVVVDAGSGSQSGAVLDAIKKITPRPIR